MKESEIAIFSNLDRSNFQNLYASWITKLMKSLSKWPTTLSKLISTTVSSDFDEYGTTILFLGFSGLHVINGSLTTGHKAAKWKVQFQLKSFFKLLKDSPARQADYIDFKGCNQFPKKFYWVRWVKSVEVCKRALEVFKYTKQHISKTKKLPNTFTVKTVK